MMHDYFQSLIANCAAEWRAIPGYEGLYEASSLGQIRSVTRMQEAKDGRKPRFAPSRIKSPTELPNKLNYLTVMFDLAGRGQKRHTVHTLVAKAFFGERPSSHHVVDHVNGNCRDNRLSNLRYITQSNNIGKKNVRGNPFYGVHMSDGKWCVVIKKDGVRHRFGSYPTREEALAVRLEKEKILFGEFIPTRGAQ